MQQKVLFVVPDSTGIKNYLFSEVLPFLYKKGVEVLVYHNLSDAAIYEVETLHNIKLPHKKIPTYHETIKQKFYREAICYARLCYNAKLVDNSTILTNWKTNHTGLKKGFYKIIERYGKYLSKDYNHILTAEKKYQKLLCSNTKVAITFLKYYNPTSVFCTHQRSLMALPIIKAANKLNIKTVGVIYSWDNLPKARLTVRTDEYLVWSEFMKQEMQKYYPEILSEKIHITGTPQFEFYYDNKLIWSKEKFYHIHNIPFNKKIILYSGGDLRTSPYDQFYVEEVAKQLLKIPKEERPILLVRPTPTDKGDRYKDFIEKYPDIIRLSSPIWNKSKNWSESYPMYDDVKLLISTVFYCETVINVGSTMAFDFATFNKPAIYINFDIVKDKNWSIKIINNFEHFRSMDNLKAVIKWDERDELSNILMNVFNKKLELDNNEWFFKINNFPKTASKRIVNLLTKF
jgi:hypothetical protein